MTNYKLILEYDGSRYHGWQKQGNVHNTIQEKLETVLARLEGRPVEVHGSGRTDAGVHAAGQVANVHLSSHDINAQQLMYYINQYLPEDIRVLSAERVPLRFHSRLQAVSKTYTYYIETEAKAPVFTRKYRYHLGQKLDIAVMQKAAGELIGTHDFRGFCGNRRMKKSTVRRLDSIEITQEGSLVKLEFTGNGFLQNMVRIMAGTLIEAGQHKRTPESAAAVLSCADRSMAGFTAPAEGLFLTHVSYHAAALK